MQLKINKMLMLRIEGVLIDRLERVGRLERFD